MSLDEEQRSSVMAGGGYYGTHSGTQHSAAACGFPLLRAAAGEVSIGAAGYPLVADLGCAEGHNSLEPVAIAIETIAARTKRDIDVVHTDLPNNDWATLFDVIEHDPDSYLARPANHVHPSVIGRSFYQRLFAPAAVSLAWCSSSLHWLSEGVGPVADNFFVQASADRAARERCRARSRDDWAVFLECRAVELVPTGSVVFVDVLMGDDGVMGSEALFDTLEQALRTARDAGTIAAGEYAAMVYPTWFRTMDELREPFTTSPAAAGLELVALEPATLADPFIQAFRDTGDAAAYGSTQAGFLRGFLEPSLTAGLEGHGEADRDAILDAVFADVASRLAADPNAVSPTYRLVSGRIRRSA